MGTTNIWFSRWFLTWIGLLLFPILTHQTFDLSSAPPSTAYPPINWTNNPSIPYIQSWYDNVKNNAKVRPILSIATPNTSFQEFMYCGFTCSSDKCDSYLFAISASGVQKQILWSANGLLIKENATLSLTIDDGLLLYDANGTLVWSTNTTNMPIEGMSITETGNLFLFNQDTVSVWQSIDHPMDTMILRQQLLFGQPLISYNNQYRIVLTDNGLAAFVDLSLVHIMYYLMPGINPLLEGYNAGVNFTDGFFAVVYTSSPANISMPWYLPKTSSPQFVRLDSDGHLRHYVWTDDYNWKVTTDVLSDNACEYPFVCGSYGICSDNGQCECPVSADGEPQYFQPVDRTRPNLGCDEVAPLICEATEHHKLIDLHNVSYFNYVDESAVNMRGIDVESCKQACMKNCTCKAAMYKYLNNMTYGDCFLPTQIFSLQKGSTYYSSSIFLKVQLSTPKEGNAYTRIKNKNVIRKKFIIYGIGGCIIGAFLIVILCIYLIKRRNRMTSRANQEDYFDDLPETPTRYTYEDLIRITTNFQKKLGKGGFGSVFEGVLADGTKVAVKRLEGASQGKKEFIAEIKSIGVIHHINLVRLIGFCTESSQRLLVYEYMPNGSLDRWIYQRHQNPQDQLSWQTWENIILGVAKGLEYLHEGCKSKIIHLDVKPQNILLDANFDAKVSDLGLAKLIDRDRSQVMMTSVRGTLGYLAPEWLKSKITEKADVFSFGIVLVEIVCGRKVLDYSQPEEDVYVIDLLKRKVEDGRLSDLLDKNSPSIQMNVEKALEMMKLAAWCLHGDSTKIPSMSMVINAIEGLVELDDVINHCEFLATNSSTFLRQPTIWDSVPQPFVLSGPR